MFYFITCLVLALFVSLLVLAGMDAGNPGDKKNRHFVSYDGLNRKVILDGAFVVVCFRQHSLNHSLFEYLNRHSGRKVTYKELDNDVLKGRVVELNKAVDAMGFKGDLKRLLFSFDSQGIMYHPDHMHDVTDIISIK